MQWCQLQKQCYLLRFQYIYILKPPEPTTYNQMFLPDEVPDSCRILGYGLYGYVVGGVLWGCAGFRTNPAVWCLSIISCRL